jgi:hypothetical protein
MLGALVEMPGSGVAPPLCGELALVPAGFTD